MAKNDFQYADGILTLCNLVRDIEIMTLNSPGGNTLQCGMWLWNHHSEFTK